MTDDDNEPAMIRETVFVTLAEVMAREPVATPSGEPGHPVFTLPAGTTVQGFRIDQNGLIELDGDFPEPKP